MISSLQKAPVLCKFAADNRWYRARVLSKKDGQAQVLYTDFGNCDIVPVKELRPLDTRFQAAAPFARECCLAFTNVLFEISLILFFIMYYIIIVVIIIIIVIIIITITIITIIIIIIIIIIVIIIIIILILRLLLLLFL